MFRNRPAPARKSGKVAGIGEERPPGPAETLRRVSGRTTLPKLDEHGARASVTSTYRRVRTWTRNHGIVPVFRLHIQIE